jgi:hypothetical protein
MNLAALLAGLFGVIVVVRALVVGGASADGQGFRREDEPMLYWSIVAAGTAATCFLLYLGISGRG